MTQTVPIQKALVTILTPTVLRQIENKNEAVLAKSDAVTSEIAQKIADSKGLTMVEQQVRSSFEKDIVIGTIFIFTNPAPKPV